MTQATSIKIDPEFKAQIPALREQELQLLEESIGAEGCREPLICWLTGDGERILIDGHNRYGICKKLGLPYDVDDRSFTDRDEAADWIDKNQLGRRNLTNDQYSIIRGRRHEREKNRRGAPIGNVNASKQRSQSDTFEDTAERIAKESGVSRATVHRDHKKYLALEELKKTNPEAVQDVYDGKKRFREVQREVRVVAVQESVKLPDAKYRVIYADPPWKYGDQLTEDYGATRFHYPPMSISELCDMPIADLCEPDAVMFFWVTSPLLYEAAPIIKAWGFAYKTSFVWDKIKHNMGHYNSVRHELLLVCTRGSCVPDKRKLYDSVQSIERSKKHSEKPQEFRYIIEDLYPHGKRLELFARAEHDGWDVYGNQIGGAQ